MLVDHGLLVRRPGLDGRPRLGVLDAIRQHAATLLDADEAADLVRRHAHHLAALVDPGPHGTLYHADLGRWAAAVDALPDLRAAIRWALDAADPDLAGDVLAGAGAAALLDAVVAAADEADESTRSVHALALGAFTAMRDGRRADAEDLLARAVEGRVGHPPHAALDVVIAVTQGGILAAGGDAHAAAALHRRTVATAREGGIEIVLPALIANLADAMLGIDEHEGLIPLIDEALALNRVVREAEVEVALRSYRGTVRLLDGDAVGALEDLTTAGAAAVRAGIPVMAADALLRAAAAIARTDPQIALECLAVVDATTAEMWPAQRRLRQRFLEPPAIDVEALPVLTQTAATTVDLLGPLAAIDRLLRRVSAG